MRLAFLLPSRAWRLAAGALALAALTACGQSEPPAEGPALEPAAAPEIETADASAEAAEPAMLESTNEFQAVGDDLGDRDSLPGAELYAIHCATCHSGGVAKAPLTSWLEMMSPNAVYTAMTDGIMAEQSAHLSDEERIHIAEYVTRRRVSPGGVSPDPAPMCEGDAAAFDLARAPSATGWGHDTARFSPADVAGLTAEQLPDLQLKWALAFPDALRARSQPSVGMGAIFVGSQSGGVYALDLETGCIRWKFQASAEVRTGIVLTPWGDGEDRPDAPLAFFGDILARAYAVNALTGELVWSLKVDEHPGATLTGTPALVGDKLYVPVSSLEIIAAADPEYACCTFRGKIVAMNPADGSVIWESFTIPEEPTEIAVTTVGTPILSPSGAPVWSSPAVDLERGLLYFGTGENYSTPADGNSSAVMAIDIETGERRWVRQTTKDDAWNVACMMADNPNCPPEDGPDFDHGSSMILIEAGERDVLAAGHKNGNVYGLDPASGDIIWRTKVGRGSIQGGVHFGMAAEGTVVYAPINDMNDTRNGDVLDPALARPGVHAIEASTGEVLWSHVQENVCGEGRPFCDPGISAAITAMPGAVVAGHLDGYVRAYAKDDGAVLWEFDTAKDFQTVSGETGRGGGMSGDGPTIADGHVIVNSGYGLYFHEPGNLLMVFSPIGE